MDYRNFIQIPERDRKGNWGDCKPYKKLSHCAICGGVFDPDNVEGKICLGCIARQRLEYLRKKA